MLKLLDDLNLVAGNVLFVQQVYVLDAAIVKHEIVHIVVVNLAGFLNDAIAGLVQPSFHKALPLRLCKLHVVERLQLRTHIGQQGCRRVQV